VSQWHYEQVGFNSKKQIPGLSTSTENAFFWRIVSSVNCLKQIFFGKTICFISDSSIMKIVQWTVNSWHSMAEAIPTLATWAHHPPSEPTPWRSFWSSRVSPSYPDSSQTTHGYFSKKIQIFISIRQCRSFPMERWRFVSTCTADTALALNSFLFPECRLHPADTRLAKLVKLWWSKKVNHFNWLKPITLQTDLRPLFKNNLCRKHLVWDPLSTSNYAFRKSVPRLQSHQIPIYL